MGNANIKHTNKLLISQYLDGYNKIVLILNKRSYILSTPNYNRINPEIICYEYDIKCQFEQLYTLNKQIINHNHKLSKYKIDQVNSQLDVCRQHIDSLYEFARIDFKITIDKRFDKSI